MEENLLCHSSYALGRPRSCLSEADQASARSVTQRQVEGSDEHQSWAKGVSQTACLGGERWGEKKRMKLLPCSDKELLVAHVTGA